MKWIDYIADVILWCFATFGALVILSAVFYTPTKAPIKDDLIRECNRKGAIYSDGVCQHVFAPICRRL